MIMTLLNVVKMIGSVKIKQAVICDYSGLQKQVVLIYTFNFLTLKIHTAVTLPVGKL